MVMARNEEVDSPLRAGLRKAAGLLVLAAMASCGSGSGGGGGAAGGGGGSGTFTATIDGQAWSGDLSVSATTSPASPGTYILGGSKLVSGSTALTLLLTLYNIGATGTYPLGVGGTVVGGTGSVTEGASSWLTPLSGAAGTVTVSTLSASTIAGTFSFTAAPLVGGGASRVVTNGSFDIPISGTPGTLPASAGSKMSATLGGAAWNAATVVTVAHSGGVYQFGGSNTDYNLNFVLSSITGPGTVSLNASTETLSITKGLQTWRSSFGGSGSVTITELSASRIKGTVTATLPDGVGAGAGTLTVADGIFDVGLP
jgi:hypothetical protein